MNTGIVAQVLVWIELASATLFASWALYISLVEHPARMAAGAAAGLAQWRPSYARAAPYQASAAALSLVAGLGAALVTGRWGWAAGGVLVGSAIPFTLIAIMPTNRRLHAPGLPAAEAGPLLARWGALHWVRTAAGLAGLALLLVEAHRP
ncbi:MAG TPA: DUF1772 domain-containing protein [Candidatus Binatia bacterium]|nr:DUF1772 domain-containing protein [Candidatus Binatia bacterium]